MSSGKFTFMVGGKAGEGVKSAGGSAANLFRSMGRDVFQMDDYQSLIRGGHNFSVVSTDTGPISSHYMAADLVVCMDQRSYDLHSAHLAEGGTMVINEGIVQGIGTAIPLTAEAKRYPRPELRLGLGAFTVLMAVAGIPRDEIEGRVTAEYRKDQETNVAYALSIFDAATERIGARYRLERGGGTKTLLTGNEAIALGAASAGLDAYFAYPMTPASSILHYLAAHDRDLGIETFHAESEIAVINMAIGATYAGSRAMVGSSGGGYALMEEALSLAGMVESPVLTVLSSRPGPSTGVPTYTAQGDLRFALNQGFGEFARIVASPGNIEEAFYLAAEMMDLVWRFQSPGIILTEKHLSESTMTVSLDPSRTRYPEPRMHSSGEYRRYLETEDGVSPLLFQPSTELIKWNSYEHDDKGITTEDPRWIARMHEKRAKKEKVISDHLRTVRTVNEFGDGPIIITYGSPTMTVLEALRTSGVRAKVVQPIYLEPFPLWEMERFRGKDVVVVEQSCTGLFETLLKEKAGIEAKAHIRRYDGRPFEPTELARAIREVI